MIRFSVRIESLVRTGIPQCRSCIFHNAFILSALRVPAHIAGYLSVYSRRHQQSGKTYHNRKERRTSSPHPRISATHPDHDVFLQEIRIIIIHEKTRKDRPTRAPIVRHHTEKRSMTAIPPAVIIYLRLQAGRSARTLRAGVSKVGAHHEGRGTTHACNRYAWTAGGGIWTARGAYTSELYVGGLRRRGVSASAQNKPDELKKRLVCSARRDCCAHRRHVQRTAEQ